MSSRKRLLALFLAFSLSFTALYGCSGKPVSSSNTSSKSDTDGISDESGDDGNSQSDPDLSGSESLQSGTDTTDPQNSAVTTGKTGTSKPAPVVNERRLIGNTYTSGFPIVKNKETLKMMVISIPSFGDLQKNGFTKDFEKLSNVKIEWMVVPESKIKERKTLALQSGNLPDVFSLYANSITQAEIETYSKNKSFVDLTDHIKTYGQNIQNAFNEYPAAREIVTNEKGKIYSLPNIGSGNIKHMLAVNKTWLSRLGISIPKTTDQFYNMLKAFKYDDPNGNGQNDEVPFAIYQLGMEPFIPFGAAGRVTLGKDGKKLVYSPITENVRQALIYWNKIYSEDLMDKTNLGDMTGDWEKYRKLIKSGLVGAWVWQDVNDFSEELIKQYEPINWPVAQLTNAPLPTKYLGVNNGISGPGNVITKACKNPTMALRVLDFFYSDEGFMYKRYGAPGKLYTKVGKDYQLKNFAPGADAKEAPGWLINGLSSLIDGKIIDAPNKPSIEVARKAFNSKANAIYHARIKEVKAKQILFKYTGAEAQRLNKYQALNDVMWNFYQPFIKGEKNVNTEWSSYVDALKSKGLDDYMKIQQAAYDRMGKIVN